MRTCHIWMMLSAGLIFALGAQERSLDLEILETLITPAKESAEKANADATEAAMAEAEAAEKRVKALVAAQEPTDPIEKAVAQEEFRAAVAQLNAARRELAELQRTDKRLSLNPTDNPLLYNLYFAAKISAEDLVDEIEQLRTDKQVGAPPSSSGTTSLVSKGSVPAVLAFAVENGALGRSESGTAVTFRGNLVGVVDLLRSKGFLEAYAEADPSTQFLRRFSYTVTFDPARELPAGADIPPSLTLTGSTRQVAGWSVRVDLVNQRDPRRREARRIWQSFSQNETRRLNAALNRVFQPVFASEEYKELISTQFVGVATASPEEIEQNAVAFAEEFWELSKRLNPDFEDAVRSAVRAAVDFAAKRREIQEELGRRPLLAFEYLQDRPRMGPSLSTFNLIGATQLFGNKAMLTGNGGLTVFNSIDNTVTPGTKNTADHKRNAYASVDLTIGLGAINEGILRTGNVTLTLAGKYERIFDTVLFRERLTEIGSMNPVALTAPGDLGIFQAKLVIPVKGTGIRLPLSFSYANRTELVKEKDVRGNFGITFDFDQLVNHFKGVILSR